VHAVQNARKTAGLEVEDRIELTLHVMLDGDVALIKAAEAHRDYIAAETLAVKLDLKGLAPTAPAAMTHAEQVTIEGCTLSIALRHAKRT
jgi:isoleucyl-tRNA synthetase